MQRGSFEGILKQLVCPSFSLPYLCWSPCLSTLQVDRFQRVLINGQCPNLQPVLEGVPKDRFLNLCFINTSLFSVNKSKKEKGKNLTNDLDMIFV